MCGKGLQNKAGIPENREQYMMLLFVPEYALSPQASISLGRFRGLNSLYPQKAEAS